MKRRFRRGLKKNAHQMPGGGEACPPGGTELSALGSTAPQGNRSVEVSVVCRHTTPRQAHDQLLPESPINTGRSGHSSPVGERRIASQDPSPPRRYARRVRTTRLGGPKPKSSSRPGNRASQDWVLLSARGRGAWARPPVKLAREFRYTGRCFSGEGGVTKATVGGALFVVSTAKGQSRAWLSLSICRAPSFCFHNIYAPS